MSNEKQAGLFWGPGIAKHRKVPTLDLAKVEKLIKNPQSMEQHLAVMIEDLTAIRENGSDFPDIRKYVSEFDQKFRKSIKVLIDRGLWPHYNSELFQKFVRDELGIQEKTASEKDVPETLLHNLNKFVEVFPKIALQAHRNLSEFKDPNYVNELKKIIYDLFFGGGGLGERAESLRAMLEANAPEDKGKEEEENKKGISTKGMGDRIRWFHEEGSEAMAKALRVLIARKTPSTDKKKIPAYMQAVKDIEQSTIVQEWEGRVVKALKEHGFRVDGSFDPKSFEEADRKFQDFVRMASDDDLGTGTHFFKDMQGAYQSYKKALEVYKDNPAMSKKVVDTYYLIVLEGKRNAYSALKDYHSRVKELDVDSIPSLETPDEDRQEETPTEKSKEESPQEEKQEQEPTSVDSNPSEEGKQDQGQKSEPKKEENAPQDRGEDPDTIVKFLHQNGDGDILRALLDTANEHNLLWNYDSNFENKKIYQDRLEDINKGVQGKVIIPEELRKDTGLLNYFFRSELSPTGKVIDLLRKEIRKPSADIGRIQSEILRLSKDSPQALEGVSKVYKEDKSRKSGPRKSEPKKEEKKKLDPSSSKRKKKEVVEELKEITKELPTPDTAIPQDQEKKVEEAKSLAEDGGESQKKDISLSEGIVQNVTDSLETALDSLEKEDVDDVVNYIDKVLLQVNKSLKSKVEDPERKKAISSRLEALVGKSSKLITSDVLSSDEKKDSLVEMLNKFLKDFENLSGGLQDQEKKILEEIRALKHFPSHDILNRDVTNLIQSVQTLVPEEEHPTQAPAETVENITSEAEETPTEPDGPATGRWEEPGVQFSKIVRGFGDFVANNDYDVPYFMLDFAEKIPHKKSVVRALGEESSQAERLRKSFDGLEKEVSSGGAVEEVGAQLSQVLQELHGLIDDDDIEEMLNSLKSEESVTKTALSRKKVFTKMASEKGRDKVVIAAMLGFFNKKKGRR